MRSAIVQEQGDNVAAKHVEQYAPTYTWSDKNAVGLDQGDKNTVRPDHGDKNTVGLGP